ncbi:COG1361 family protein [Leucobacter salsicius]|uniref:hypothetical protein n=1 Tax=Leucobacter salsicius TaxID=664638 RepID=UPI0003679EBA|nr:hypothetical protein [Leucobacter salsicius]
MGAHQCIGGALQPGESRSLRFELGAPVDASVVASQWTGRVELNEVDTNLANNTAKFSPAVPAPIDVRTDVKARVIDTNGDGAASPGEKIEVYVLVENNSPETLTSIAVQLDTIIPQNQELEGSILPGARRTIKFENVVPRDRRDHSLEPEGTGKRGARECSWRRTHRAGGQREARH